MASLAHHLKGALGHLQTLVELAIARFSHGLQQVTLGEVAGEILDGQICRQRARLPDRGFAILPSGLVGSHRSAAWHRDAGAHL